LNKPDYLIAEYLMRIAIDDEFNASLAAE